MFTLENTQKAHDKINHIFKDLLPAQGMAERSEQVALSHRMLDAMVDNSIALCDIKALDMIQNYKTITGKIM